MSHLLYWPTPTSQRILPLLWDYPLLLWSWHHIPTPSFTPVLSTDWLCSKAQQYVLIRHKSHQGSERLTTPVLESCIYLIWAIGWSHRAGSQGREGEKRSDKWEWVGPCFGGTQSHTQFISTAFSWTTYWHLDHGMLTKNSRQTWNHAI